MEIRNLVKKIIEKHGTTNPFEIAHSMNIGVVFEPLGTLRGYYNYFKKNKFIHINDTLPVNEQRIVCAHELGHAIVHKSLNISFLTSNTYFIKSKFEIEANLFAAELLIDDELLQNYEGLTIEQIAIAENINIELLKLKFNLGNF